VAQNFLLALLSVRHLVQRIGSSGKQASFRVGAEVPDLSSR